MVRKLLGHANKVNSVAFSPDGRFIASGSADRTMCFWDVQTGAQVGEPLRGHTDSVTSVAFSPDGRSIASGSWDTTVRVWDARIDVSGAGQSLETGDAAPASGDDENAVYSKAPFSGPDKNRAIWNAHCSRMVISDGWVKDGDSEKLLLWVPYRYRERFRNRLLMVIGEKEEFAATRVDVEELFEYAGTAWTNIYPRDSADASSSLSLP